MNLESTIRVGNAKFLNLFRGAEVLKEIVGEDCYRLSSIPDGATVIDVGAFYGDFGLLCHINKKCKVIAFEPSLENLQIAKANAALNNVETGRDAYELHWAAVSAIHGKMEFYYRPDHPAGSSSTKILGETSTFVPCVTMTFAVQLTLLRYGDENPIVLKLDCEGAEKEIFKGPLDWLRHISFLCLEWHNFDGKIYARELESRGFTVELTGGGSPRPAFKEGMAGGLIFAKRNSA